MGPAASPTRSPNAAALTDRDLTLIELLHEHDVLTGDQIARLYFTSPGRARHRLLELTRRRVLARFRHRLDRGSQHWRYTLGVVGATLHAAAHADPIPRPTGIAARTLALASSPRLDNRIATNEVFVALTHHTRTHHTPAAGHPRLAAWWSERQATGAFGNIVRPDRRDRRRRPALHHPPRAPPTPYGYAPRCLTALA